MSLEFYESGDAIASAGLAIPISDLPMVSVGEFVAAQSTPNKEGKALLGFGLALDNYINTNPNLLSFIFTKGTAIAGNLLTFTFSVLHYKYSRLVDGSYNEIPIPSTGAKNGVGGLNIDNVFPNAEVVSATNVVGTNTTFNEECVVIPNADIASYSNSEIPAIGIDKRNWFNGFMMSLGDIITLRDASNPSGITATNNPSNYSILTLPATYYSATDPLSDIPSSDLGKIASVQKTVSYSVQVLVANDGTYEINVATS